MLRLWLSILPAFLLLPEYGMTGEAPGGDSGMDNVTIEYNMDDRLVPSKYQKSYALVGLRCFPDGLRLPCDCDEQHICPCCYDYESENYTCYAPTYYEWSLWAPCDLYNELCDHTQECRTIYTEVSFRSAVMDPVSRKRKRRGVDDQNMMTPDKNGCQVQRAQCRPKQYGEWGPWREGPCSSTCMVGIKLRTRDCLDIATNETIDISLCEGGEDESYEELECNTDGCEELSGWVDEGRCFNDSGHCAINQMQTCIEPAILALPEGCGMQTADCPFNCSLLGVSDYLFGQWYGCNSSCSPGLEQSDGNCVYLIDNAPSTECELGNSITEYRECDSHLCDSYSEWINGSCSEECGGGYLNSTRRCEDEGEIPEMPDDCDLIMYSCNEQECIVELDITIVTGSGPDAGTNAAVTVQLVGDIGNKTLIFAPMDFPGEFVSNKSFNYIEDIAEIGTLLIVNIGHDNTGDDPSWFLEEVSITLGGTSYEFPCGTWFDSAIGDGMTTRELMPNEQCHQENFIYDWSDWSPCSMTCMPGIRMRNGTCKDNATMLDSDNCVNGSTTVQYGDCNIDLCLNYELWGNWSACSATCGNGTQVRNRTCSDGGEVLALCGMMIRDCNEAVCVEVGDWGNYSDCSETCMAGTQTRTRGCFEEGTQIPATGCTDALNETDVCNTHLCDDYTPFVGADTTACRADRSGDMCTSRKYEASRTCIGSGSAPDACLDSEIDCGDAAPPAGVPYDIFIGIYNDVALAMENLLECQNNGNSPAQLEVLNDVKDFLYRLICSFNTFENMNSSRIAVADGTSAGNVVKDFDDSDLFSGIEGISRQCDQLAYANMAVLYGGLDKRDSANKAFITILSSRTTEQLGDDSIRSVIRGLRTTSLVDTKHGIIAAFNTTDQDHLDALNEYVCLGNVGPCDKYLGTIWDDPAMTIQRIINLFA